MKICYNEEKKVTFLTFLRIFTPPKNCYNKLNLRKDTVCSVTNFTQTPKFYTIPDGVDGDIWQVCQR